MRIEPTHAAVGALVEDVDLSRPLTEDAVEGLPEAESRELIAFLTRHLTDARFVYRWRPGDLAMWDNRLTMHRRDGFDNARRRVMKRTQSVGALSR